MLRLQFLGGNDGTLPKFDHRIPLWKRTLLSIESPSKVTSAHVIWPLTFCAYNSISVIMLDVDMWFLTFLDYI